MDLRVLIGEVPVSEERKQEPRLQRARVHQGWWRAFVLGQEQGPHPIRPQERICSTLNSDTAEFGNFVSNEIGELAIRIGQEHSRRGTDRGGIVQIDRLKTNLLSSQPLCFNFFGLFALDRSLGLRAIRAFFPDVTGLRDVKFEYAPTPKHSFTDDNSAFDVALEVEVGDKVGLIGIECKYTESFSPKAYRKNRYKELYDASNNFNASYDELTASAFNQLFRNQIIAESLLQSGIYQFVKTALFCSPDDVVAKKTGAKFAEMLKCQFRVFDYFELVTAMQRLELTTQQREISMRLWARYIAYSLSETALGQYKSESV
jgi:hypothetical protein